MSATDDEALELARHDFDGVIVRCDARVEREVAREWAQRAEAWFGSARRPVPRAETRAHVALVDTPLGLAVAKRERARAWQAPLLRFGWRAFRRERSFKTALELARSGLPIARPIACITARRRAFACTLTSYAPGADPWSFVAAGGELETLVTTLAELVARLHRARIRHRDLKAPNLVVTGSPSAPRIVVIDADGAARTSWPDFGVAVRDLGRLCASFDSPAARACGVTGASWSRCVERYLELAQIGHCTADDLEHRTRRWAAAHTRDLSRRGRALA